MGNSFKVSRFKPFKRRKMGFTLLEIMVVMAILAMLVALVAPNILSRSDDAKVAVAKTQLRNIVSALDLYKLDNGNYPSTSQGLQALVTRPTGYPEARNWKQGGYLPSLPKDPWGADFLYISPGAQGAYDLLSLGSDGREGGEGDASDIVSRAL
ncbi:type II secretion system major pseudopilin GspG [Marinomonas ostreistagni]|uniref:Type II secretion system core protein G n=1 Tax=Marinomonas ostreistagni TaxID=359209 RepID=A0ABS0ZAZ9_9GAMM|nr:type II secretion system major pseudopilin GspG [Marinomonas ostreistagni]MBJ7550831.1 type II secretion system major pseudopilin GspG [Marinomonas ostreistagni]